MTTIFDRLREDHATQRTLMRLMLKTKGDSQGRRELFERLRSAMERHAAAEERAFYGPLLQHETGRKHAAHSVHEHAEMRALLEELAETPASSSGWLSVARKLVELNAHHMDEEEREVFPVAGRIFSVARKETLGTTFAEIKAQLMAH